MTREQIVDAIECGKKGCSDCSMPHSDEKGCFELLAEEALHQRDRAERWKAVARYLRKMVDLYDNDGGIDEQVLKAIKQFDAAMEQEAQG